VVAGDGSPLFSSDEEMVDEGLRDQAKSNPWSMRSIASCRDAEGRLEACGAQGSFGSSCSRRSAAG
jgi:hypothetical protein